MATDLELFPNVPGYGQEEKEETEEKEAKEEEDMEEEEVEELVEEFVGKIVELEDDIRNCHQITTLPAHELDQSDLQNACTSDEDVISNDNNPILDQLRITIDENSFGYFTLHPDGEESEMTVRVKDDTIHGEISQHFSTSPLFSPSKPSGSTSSSPYGKFGGKKVPPKTACLDLFGDDLDQFAKTSNSSSTANFGLDVAKALLTDCLQGVCFEKTRVFNTPKEKKKKGGTYFTNEEGSVSVEKEDTSYKFSDKIRVLQNEELVVSLGDKLEIAITELSTIRHTKDIMATENAKLLSEKLRLTKELADRSQQFAINVLDNERIQGENDWLKSNLSWENGRYTALAADSVRKSVAIEKYEQALNCHEDSYARNISLINQLQSKLESSYMSLEDNRIIVSQAISIKKLNLEILTTNDFHEKNLDILKYSLVTIQGERGYWENRAKSIAKDLGKKLSLDTHSQIKKELLDTSTKLEQALFERRAFKDAMIAAYAITKNPLERPCRMDAKKKHDKSGPLGNEKKAAYICNESSAQNTADDDTQIVIVEDVNGADNKNKSQTKANKIVGGCFMGRP